VTTTVLDKHAAIIFKVEVKPHWERVVLWKQEIRSCVTIILVIHILVDRFLGPNTPSVETVRENFS
jgi:hypothetical protein